jgi:hypothetical protein
VAGGAGNKDFNVALNWSAGVPTTTIDAAINGTSASPLTVSLASGTGAAKTLSATFTTLDLSGGALSIVGTSTLDALDQSGGLLEFKNSTVVSSSFTGFRLSAGMTREMLAWRRTCLSFPRGRIARDPTHAAGWFPKHAKFDDHDMDRRCGQR